MILPQNFLEIGVWKKLEQTQRLAPYEQMKVWETRSQAGLLEFKNSKNFYKSNLLGYIVENNVLQDVLLDEIQHHSSIDFLAPRKVSGIEHDSEDLPIKVTLSDDSHLFTKLLIGADGGNSDVRNFFNFDTVGWSYDQRAIGAVVEHTQTNSVAYQRFLPTGPIALLPVNLKKSIF